MKVSFGIVNLVSVSERKLREVKRLARDRTAPFEAEPKPVSSLWGSS